MSPALLLYALLGTLFFFVSLPYSLWRFARRPREMAERFALAAHRVPGLDRPLWLHAASLGELEALSVLLRDPVYHFRPPLFVTVLSVSARARAAEKLPSGIPVSFAPLDFWFSVLAFTARTRPRGLLIAETEIWPLTLAICRARGIPVALISGRLSRRKWARTRRFAFLFGPLLSKLDGLAVQSPGDAVRFGHLGATSISLTGNLKYTPLRDPLEADERAGDGAFWFTAGSVRQGEEGVLAAGRGTQPPDLLVLVPRHLREREKWIRACLDAGLELRIRSDFDFEVPPASRLRRAEERDRFRREVALALRMKESGEQGRRPVLLVDRHGELSSWYAASDAAFVGGSLVPIGGHNLYEPAREGIPVAFGPQTEEVEDLAALLLTTGGGKRVEDGPALSEWLRELRLDPERRRRMGAAAREAAVEISGAAERTWTFLGTLRWTRVESRSGSAGAG